MNKFARLAVAALLTLCAAPIGNARAETKVRFSLDWIPGGMHAPFFVAYYKGYYKAEGLDVVIDRGKGSVGLVQQLATGVYDMGYPDTGTVIDFYSKNPDKGFPMLMIGYEQAPAGVVVLKSSKITEPKQLEGRTLGAAANDASFKLFPTFAAHAGFDMAKIKVQLIDPKLRETLLAKRDVDAIIGQVFNTTLELKAKGIDPKDVVPFYFRDHGLDLYGNGIAASPQFLKEHPDAVKGFIRASIKGFQDTVKNPEEAIAMTLKYEPLLNAGIERDRLKLVMECCIMTPNVLKHGIGYVDKARLERGIGILVNGLKLPSTPKPEAIFNSAYLPPEKDRMVK